MGCTIDVGVTLNASSVHAYRARVEGVAVLLPVGTGDGGREGQSVDGYGMRYGMRYGG
jgi:hypothetical protein